MMRNQFLDRKRERPDYQLGKLSWDRLSRENYQRVSA